MFVCTGFDVFLSVSDRAWEIIEEVGYVGYDALLPFRTAVKMLISLILLIGKEPHS